MSDGPARQSVPPGGPPPAAPAPAFSFAALPPVHGFDALIDPSAYVSLPEDWVLGLADVTDSTGAIAAGRYKAVNTAGAAVISAVTNALGRRDFPFLFAGDGASFAVPPEDVAKAGEALAATVSWVGHEIGLTLRGGLMSVADIRAAGLDVTVARFAASPDVCYTMFSGGGRAWAEDQLKAGRLTLPPAPAQARPDLTGLSCRFEDIMAAHGVILSLIVRLVAGADEVEARAVLGEILGIAGRQARSAHPVPVGGPALRWPKQGLDLEAKLKRPSGWPLLAARLAVRLRTAVAHMIMRRGADLGGFSPARYRRQMVDNSDFRKFDDGLMMTLDCTIEVADEIEMRLQAAAAAGLLRYGLHRQRSALVTCMVPSAMRSDHVHFIDGASGGYAMAAQDLKRPVS